MTTVLPALPDEILEQLRPALERLDAEVKHTVRMGESTQRLDLVTAAAARARGGGMYADGQETAMAGVVGGAEELRELRERRVARRRAGAVLVTPEDKATGLVESGADPDARYLRDDEIPVPQPQLRGNGAPDDEDEDDEDDDHEDDVASCCGCCNNCGERHDDYDDYAYHITMRSGRDVRVCTECGHQCMD